MILPGLSQAFSILSHNCARPDNITINDDLHARLCDNTYHFIFRHSEAASLGTWNWLFRVVLALLEVVGEAVKLDHGGTAVQLIVAPVRGTCNNPKYCENKMLKEKGGLTEFLTD